MSLSKINALESILEKEGYVDLLEACQAIVGSDGTENGMTKSINEDGMKEGMGISKVSWLRYKVTILENITIFKTKCKEVGLNPDIFLKNIEEEVMKVENFL